MSNLLLLLLFVIITQSCKGNKKHTIIESYSEEKVSTKDTLIKEVNNTVIKIQKKDYDVLRLDSLKLDNRALYFKRKELDKFWTKPDSITSFFAECGYLENKTVKKYYFKGLFFHVYNDNVELSEIDFVKSNKAIKHPKLNLSRDTDLSEFKLEYKNSYRERSESLKKNDLHTVLRFRTRENWDEYIHLLFKNNKLVKLVIWNPC